MKSRKKSARMNMIHFRTLTGRYARQIISSPQSFCMLLLQVPVMLIIIAVMYKRDCFVASYISELQITVIGDIVMANATVFVIVFMGSLMGLLNSYREITKERDILSREMSGGLDVNSYTASKLCVQGVIALCQALLLCGGTLAFIDFGWPRPWLDIPLYFLTEFLVILSSASMGLLVSAAVKRSENAVLPVLVMIICQVVFAGVFIVLPEPINNIGSLFPARWGCTVIGNILRLNTYNASYTRAIYNDKIVVAIILLVAITVICYTLTAAILSGKNRKKK